MEKSFHRAFTLSVTYFPHHIATITSRSFSSGGCEWFIMGNFRDKYLSVYLSTKPKSLGWKSRASFYFVFLNQSGKEICRTSESGDKLFCAESPKMGFPKAFSLKKLLKKEFSVKDEFSLEVYIKVVDGYDMVPSSLSTKQFLKSEKETVDVNGFQVLSSQVISVRQIFSEHPDIAKDLTFKNQLVKTEYMNVLLNLLETIKKPLKSISETDLSKANSDLCELTEVGFKVEWLKTKLEEVSLVCKKVNAEGFQIQQLEEQVKNLELTVSGLKGEAAKVFSLEKELSDLKTELANEKAKSERATANFVSLKEVFFYLRIELEKEKAKSANVTAKALSLKRTWYGLKVKKDHKKENSTTITDNLLSWEDADLVSPTNCLGNDYKRIN